MASSPSRRHGAGSAREGRRSFWAALWGSFACYLLLPANRGARALAQIFTTSASGEPGWLRSVEGAAANLIGSHGVVSVLLALACTFAALVFQALLYETGGAGGGSLRPGHLGGRGLRGILTGTGTDPNTGLLLVLLAACYSPYPVRGAAASPTSRRGRRFGLRGGSPPAPRQAWRVWRAESREAGIGWTGPTHDGLERAGTTERGPVVAPSNNPHRKARQKGRVQPHDRRPANDPTRGAPTSRRRRCHVCGAAEVVGRKDSYRDHANRRQQPEVDRSLPRPLLGKHNASSLNVRANTLAAKTAPGVAQKGVALTLFINVLNASNGSKPLSGVAVDIWHANLATGLYSDETSQQAGGGTNSGDTSGEDFLRGYQVTGQAVG